MYTPIATICLHFFLLLPLSTAFSYISFGNGRSCHRLDGSWWWTPTAMIGLRKKKKKPHFDSVPFYKKRKEKMSDWRNGFAAQYRMNCCVSVRCVVHYLTCIKRKKKKKAELFCSVTLATGVMMTENITIPIKSFVSLFKYIPKCFLFLLFLLD